MTDGVNTLRYRSSDGAHVAVHLGTTLRAVQTVAAGGVIFSAGIAGRVLTLTDGGGQTLAVLEEATLR